MEERQLLSASAAKAFVPAGYSPSQLRSAYGFNQINFGPIAGDGRGQTIAIVVAYDDPDIASDLAQFDKQFKIPAPPQFTKINLGAAPGPIGWGQEESLDVEWAHAIAPAANIDVVEAASDYAGDLYPAAATAAKLPGVSVVSMSFYVDDFAGETAYDSDFTTPAGHIPVSFVACSGDDGGVGGATYPADSPNVLGVGGTTLVISPGGQYVSESAWNGSSGGVSTVESEPSYQEGVQQTGFRTSPDVAYDANSVSPGYAVFDSYLAPSGSNGWLTIGGTSAGAPQWAALVAIANQGRALFHEPTLSDLPAAIYSIPRSDFHDIVTGSSLEHPATRGYDLATGLGSPYAQRVVQSLVSLPCGPDGRVEGASAAPTDSNAGTASAAAEIGSLVAMPGISGVSSVGSSGLSPGAVRAIPAHNAAPAPTPVFTSANTPTLAASSANGLSEIAPVNPTDGGNDAQPVSGGTTASEESALFATPPNGGTALAPLGEEADNTATAASLASAGALDGLVAQATDACFADGTLAQDASNPLAESATSHGDNRGASKAFIGAIGLAAIWGVRRRARSVEGDEPR